VRDSFAGPRCPVHFAVFKTFKPETGIFVPVKNMGQSFEKMVGPVGLEPTTKGL